MDSHLATRSDIDVETGAVLVTRTRRNLQLCQSCRFSKGSSSTKDSSKKQGSRNWVSRLTSARHTPMRVAQATLSSAAGGYQLPHFS